MDKWILFQDSENNSELLQKFKSLALKNDKMMINGEGWYSYDEDKFDAIINFVKSDEKFLDLTSTIPNV